MVEAAVAAVSLDSFSASLSVGDYYSVDVSFYFASPCNFYWVYFTESIVLLSGPFSFGSFFTN